MPQKGKITRQRLYVLARRLAKEVSNCIELLQRTHLGSVEKKEGRKEGKKGGGEINLAQIPVFGAVSNKSQLESLLKVSAGILIKTPHTVKDQKSSYLSRFHAKNFPFSSDIT